VCGEKRARTREREREREREIFKALVHVIVGLAV
jgi:hypothetical protein